MGWHFEDYKRALLYVRNSPTWRRWGEEGVLSHVDACLFFFFLPQYFFLYCVLSNVMTVVFPSPFSYTVEYHDLWTRGLFFNLMALL